MAETTVLAIEHIVKTPGVCGGDPRVAGRRITVDFVVNYIERLKGSVEEMTEAFDLTPAQIHAALAYYYDHREEIDALIAEAEQLYQADIALHPERDITANWRAREGVSPDSHMTVIEVSQEFGADTSTIRRAIYAGKVTARKAGGIWLISRKDAEARWGTS